MHKHLLDSQVSRIGIHRTQHIILMHISRRGKLPSQTELADHLNITPAAVTGALKRLESDGYIVRKLGNDNRYNEVTITKSGLDLVEYTETIFSEIDRSLFNGFSDEELELYINFLDKIQKNISARMEQEDI